MAGNYGCSAGSSLPVIHVRGTHYQVGFETGRLTKEQIQTCYAGCAPLHRNLLPFIKTEKGRKIFEGYLDFVCQELPQYLEEIRGLSDGSGVPFEQVFVMHIRSEISSLLYQGRYGTPACTTVFLNRDDAIILGHNEDGSPEMKGLSILVSAEVLGENGIVIEQFTAFTYPGTLPGCAFGFNRAGLIFTVNSQSPIAVPAARIPLDVLNRALLSATCPEDFERIINMAPGVSQGCSLNVVFTRHPIESMRMQNYEILGSFDPQLHTVIDAATAFRYDSAKADVKGNGFMYHFNEYERVAVEQNAENIVSPVHRETRAKQLPVPRTLADVLAFLGDTGDSECPIFRTTTGKDGGCTIATALFDLKEMTMAVYRDNPRMSAPLLTLPIPKSF